MSIPSPELNELVKILLNWTTAGTVWQTESDTDSVRYHIKSLLPQYSESSNSNTVGFKLRHSQYQVRILYFEADGGLKDIVVVLESTPGDVIQAWTVTGRDAAWLDLCNLRDAIKTSTIKRALADFQAAKAPRSVTEEGYGFFRSVVGVWRLEYGEPRRPGSGSEEATIDIVGNYFIKGQGPLPVFYLQNVFYDPVNLTVSFSKIFARGERMNQLKQIEVLKIDSAHQKMIGNAQHDNHPLTYTKIISPAKPHGSGPTGPGT